MALNTITPPLVLLIIYLILPLSTGGIVRIILNVRPPKKLYRRKAVHIYIICISDIFPGISLLIIAEQYQTTREN